MDENENKSQPLALDDSQRVKILSPGMMVYKRFIRNRLAITGLVILVVMFLFSFAGGFFYPYGQAQVFKGIGMVDLNYAVAAYNEELRFYEAENATLSSAARAQFLLAIAQNKETFSYNNVEYTIMNEGGDFYRIGGYVTLVEAVELRGKVRFQPVEGATPDDALMAAIGEAYTAGRETFEYENNIYQILRGGRSTLVGVYQDYAIASRRVVDAYNEADNAIIRSYAFRLAAEESLFEQADHFEVGGKRFTLEMEDDDNGTVYAEDGTTFAEISTIIITPPVENPIFLPVSFKKDIREAIIHREPFFSTDTATNEMRRYDVYRVNQTYNIKTSTPTEVIFIHEAPSKLHPMGTDANGMDMLARLMYGGRISLTVGFVVVIIEMLIGVVIGGISGYFSGWVDTLLMRFVDLFNTIPQFPMLIILGSILDAYRVDPMKRIYLLMFILGVLGWTGIARVVRGQILSLREQDFMMAAEASGLSVFRRIFKHLVPNVMPLLIVNATMGLGGIILTEATLSFLGLGVKYPLASWGSIANAATSVTVMTFFPWTWIPAGILIFTTVLGFNFVGDGLRDAFDPKMKR